MTRVCLGSSLMLLFVVGCDQALEPFAPNLKIAAPPSNTNVVVVSESQITVSWQDNSSNETRFEVYRSTAGASGEFVMRAFTGSGVTSYSDVGLTPSTQYCYRVRAKTADRKTSYSDFSNTACATTLAPPPPVPAAPSGLDAKPFNSTTITMQWVNNSTNADAFRVERSLDFGSTWTTVSTLLSFITSRLDGGRTSEQQVCYRVIAVNSVGDSPPSNTDCTTPPARPTNLMASVVDQQTIDLTWTDNSGVEDSYEVRRDGWIVATLPANATAYRDAGLTPDNAYGYVVRATKDGGPSDYSSLVRVVVTTLPPVAPANVNAVPSGNSIQISWLDQSPNDEGFRVERSTDGGMSWATALTTSWSSATASDLERPVEQEACYRVIAFNNVGDSPPSNTDCTTPAAGPTHLIATRIDANTIALTWTDNSAVEDHFEVWVITAPCYEEEMYYPIATPPANSTGYVDTAPAESYVCAPVWYYVAAKKDGGYSWYSNLAPWPAQ